MYPYSYYGKLRILTTDGQKLVVDEVIDHWQEAECEYLRLLAEDERIYFLRREQGNQWEVERFYSY
jgi:hypothetical protein